MELAREGEGQAARWAARQLASLKAQCWEKAPKGAMLVEAILEAYRRPTQ